MDDVLALDHVLEADQARVQPLVVGVLPASSALISSSSMIRCSSVSTRNIRPGLSRPLRTMVAGSRSSTDLRGEDDESVVGHPVARRTQAVAVEDRADLRAVGEDDDAGPSQGSISAEWNS